jgi:hypothetical protein
METVLSIIIGIGGVIALGIVAFFFNKIKK